MTDTWIIIAAAILFPLFGAAVFFYWRIQYGVGVPWLSGRRGGASDRDDTTEVIVERFQERTSAPQSPTTDRDQGRRT